MTLKCRVHRPAERFGGLYKARDTLGPRLEVDPASHEPATFCSTLEDGLGHGAAVGLTHVVIVQVHVDITDYGATGPVGAVDIL